jgi:hypothetical protein
MNSSEIQELLQLMEDHRLRLKGDREASRKFLIDAGIFDENGDYTEPYKRLREEYDNLQEQEPSRDLH